MIRCATKVSPIEIPTQTSHDGKYDPRMLNTGDPEHPAVAGTKTLVVKHFHNRRALERSNDG
jgi:hypothetical protein